MIRSRPDPDRGVSAPSSTAAATLDRFRHAPPPANLTLFSILGRPLGRCSTSLRGNGQRAFIREAPDTRYGRMWYAFAISCIMQTFSLCIGIFLQARKNRLSIQLMKARCYGVGPMDRQPRSIDIPDSDWQFTDECRRGDARVTPPCRAPCINARLR